MELEGGKVFGSVPYPLLNLPQANQSFFLQEASFFFLFFLNLFNFENFLLYFQNIICILLFYFAPILTIWGMLAGKRGKRGWQARHLLSEATWQRRRGSQGGPSWPPDEGHRLHLHSQLESNHHIFRTWRHFHHHIHTHQISMVAFSLPLLILVNRY